MATTRTLIANHLDALIDRQHALDFQRLAQQCFRHRWPSLAAVPEQADLGEDAITIVGEGSDAVRRSLLCSLTATFGKLRTDALKLQRRNLQIHELVFATPRTVARRKQERWSSAIKQEFGWTLVVVERSELLTVLSQAENRWMCREYLALDLGHQHIIEEAKAAQKAGRLAEAKSLADEAERAALTGGDDEGVCRARIFQAELFLERGDAASFKERAFLALQTAREKRVDPVLAECLILAANSAMQEDPDLARKFLAEAERSISSEDKKTRSWLLLVRARLQEGSGELAASQRTLREWQTLAKGRKQVDEEAVHYLRFRIGVKRNEVSARRHLEAALRRARAKSRWTFVGDMLLERALHAARANNLAGATADAREAATAYAKSANRPGEGRAFLLAAQFQLDANEAEAALSLANESLDRSDVRLHRRTIEGALQIRTRALQALGRIQEARESNLRFRDTVALQPQAFIVADTQEAVLLAQEGRLDDASALMTRTLQRARDVGTDSAIVAAVRIHLAEILIRQAKLREARHQLGQSSPEIERLPPRARESFHSMLKYLDATAYVATEFENFLALENPLQVAGTADTPDIRAAHRSVINMLLEWTTNFPKAAPPILDFWGRGNFVRYLLNHRGFPNTWHVTVEATTVAQADYWTRVLCPLVDVLTILWKGPVQTVFCNTPIHDAYEGPGGWGYMVAAGSRMRSETDPSDWNWAPAMGAATLVPDDAAEFLFIKARKLLEAGRLLLVPAPNVGCIGKGHTPLEQIFNIVANAVPWLTGQGRNADARTLASFPLPYFPQVSLDELARVVEDEEHSLLELRRALRAWATAAGQGALDTVRVGRELHDQVESGLRAVERKYEDLARRLSWGRASGEIHSYVLEPRALQIQPPTLAAAALMDLYGDVRSSPWYAFFRLGRAGYRWDLTSAAPSGSTEPSTTYGGQRVYHWIVPPSAGWTVPSARIVGA